MRSLFLALLAWLALVTNIAAEYSPNAVAPSYVTSGAGLMYASTCAVTVNSSTPTSCFCPNATDSKSNTSRTYPANTLTIGRAFWLVGGGTYTVPTGNTLAADIKIKIGTNVVMSVTTPAAPVSAGTQEVDFYAVCVVRTTTTMNCHGQFTFSVAGTGLSANAPFDQTNTFDPNVADLVDVTGDWNGTTTTHATVVSEAILMAFN